MIMYHVSSICEQEGPFENHALPLHRWLAGELGRDHVDCHVASVAVDVDHLDSICLKGCRNLHRVQGGGDGVGSGILGGTKSGRVGHLERKYKEEVTGPQVPFLSLNP